MKVHEANYRLSLILLHVIHCVSFKRKGNGSTTQMEEEAKQEHLMGEEGKQQPPKRRKDSSTVFVCVSS